MICAQPWIAPQARAAPPEPLDREFLDYLAACESSDHDWTVVADEEVRKKLAQKKKRAPASDKDAQPRGARP
jgi:hypothetical protein